MKNIEEITNEIIEENINNRTLFTALDISNKVKEILPFAKHREVRDIVRTYYNNGKMNQLGYSRTPIKVTLLDGSVTDALLYHSLADTWDLDNKYDAQKRIATKTVINSNVAVSVSPASATVCTSVVQPTIPAVNNTPLTLSQIWQSLFDSKPSIFSFNK